ncbi:hypothetical protein PC1_2795 [Pectobacterium carotovorum subsp. carotovorum PC1]|uniref:Uncharacterized protein n=1 Tax=Pectobacterium carotovorum subsp. carotovorum (strain PC1) TaxID=561230 RepID=C6DA69_PECCP|nr:hypothetical protein PC1_2795 [Pectobacterium carotovorum subsp. carotovorum PC1]
MRDASPRTRFEWPVVDFVMPTVNRIRHSELLVFSPDYLLMKSAEIRYANVFFFC